MKTVWKSFKYPTQYKYMSILKYYEAELDFIPKILEYNKEGYRYEWIYGMSIREAVDTDTLKLNQKMIFEMKMAMDDIWKKLYKVSIDMDGHLILKILYSNQFLWHGDQHLGNTIWRDDSKELILIDIDSFVILPYIPLSYLNNVFIQQLENYMHIFKRGEE